MLEAGLVTLLMANASVQAICTHGGYAETLPKDLPLPSWWYRRISTRMPYGLRGEHSFSMTRFEINCHGAKAADGQQLRAAVDSVLSGFKGALSDPDHTVIDACFQSDWMDLDFDEASRSYRFMVEYEIQFFT